MLDQDQGDKIDLKKKVELIILEELVRLIELQELEDEIEVELLEDKQLKQKLQKLVEI